MSVIWTVFVVVVLLGVAGLFIVDALQQRTAMAKVAALMVLVAGAMFGAELLTPWVPLAVLLVAFCLGVAGRLGTESSDDPSRGHAGPKR